MSKRYPITVTVWATGLFTVAGIGFQKLSEDFTGVARGSYAVIVTAAAVALLALIAAAAPTAGALLRGQDRGAWMYVAVPVLGIAVWYAVLRLALAISGNHGVHSVPTVIGFAVIAVVGVAVVVSTAWAAARVLRQVPATAPAGLRPTALLVVAVGMAVTTVATLIWGLRIRTDDPAGFHGAHGILATPFVPNWIATVVLMTVATGLAANAGRRQLAAPDSTTTPIGATGTP